MMVIRTRTRAAWIALPTLLIVCARSIPAEDANFPSGAGSAGASSSGTQPASAPTLRFRRIVDPESAVQFRLDETWKQKASSEATAFVRDGGNSGSIVLRFPPDFKTQPQSPESLRDADIKSASSRAEWKKERRKSVSATWEMPSLPDGLVAISNGVEGVRDKKAFLGRNFYITSPVKGIVAVSCELPLEAVGADDACITFIKTATVLSAEERQQRLARLDMMNRLTADSDKDDVPCSKVNEEMKEFRSLYSNAKLEDAPRFQRLSVAMTAVYLQNMSKIPASKLKEYLALMKETPAMLQQLEDECRANPEQTFKAAGDKLFKTRKSESK
jgi:hypothetical protein